MMKDEGCGMNMDGNQVTIHYSFLTIHHFSTVQLILETF